MRMWTVQSCAEGHRDYWICQVRGGRPNTFIESTGTTKWLSTYPHTVHSCEYMDKPTHVNMPEIRDGLRSWAKPQHSSARYFSPEAPALLATCIQLPVPLSPWMMEKDFVQAAVMSSSATTPGNETGRQLLHNLNQYCRKGFVPSNTNQNQVSAGGGLGRCSSMASVVF